MEVSVGEELPWFRPTHLDTLHILDTERDMDRILTGDIRILDMERDTAILVIRSPQN